MVSKCFQIGPIRNAINPNVWGLASLGLDLKLDLDLIWVRVSICSLGFGIGLDLVIIDPNSKAFGKMRCYKQQSTVLGMGQKQKKDFRIWSQTVCVWIWIWFQMPKSFSDSTSPLAPQTVVCNNVSYQSFGFWLIMIKSKLMPKARLQI